MSHKTLVELLDREISETAACLESLRATRAYLAARLGERPEAPAPVRRGPGKKKAKHRSAPAETLPPPNGREGQGAGVNSRQKRAENVKKCADVIARDGPLGALEIARRAGVPSGSISSTLAHPWFQKADGGKYVLSVIGVREHAAGLSVDVED